MRLSSVSTAPTDLSDIMGMPPAIIAAHRPDPEDFSCDYEAFEATMNDLFYLEFGEVQRLHERFVDTKASSKEEALLNQIFGIKTEFSKTTMGVGFWLDGLPPKFLEFAKKHKDAIFAPYRPEPKNLDHLAIALDEAIQKTARLSSRTFSPSLSTSAPAITTLGPAHVLLKPLRQPQGSRSSTGSTRIRTIMSRAL